MLLKKILLECDSFLRRYYFYLIGKESQLDCKTRHFATSLQQCRSWATLSCQTQSPDGRLWLRQRSKREAWAWSAGVLSAIRWLWEHTGHSCADNNISGLLGLFFQMTDSMSTSQRMIHTVYGKQVYLIRMTDRLTTRVNILSDALRLVDKTFRAWQTKFRAFAKTAQCHYDASLEFLSKYTMEINRALMSLLRLQELDDFVRQAEKITTRELVGFNDFPRSISTELSAELSTIPSIKSTVDALDSSFPLLIRPILDYYFSVNSKCKLNILFTIPSLTAYNEFCTLQSLTPLKYNISGVCFTVPLSREDVMLVTCLNQRYFVHTAALHKCYTTSEAVLCPKSLLLKATHTDWLGMAWTPRSR